MSMQPPASGALGSTPYSIMEGYDVTDVLNNHKSSSKDILEAQIRTKMDNRDMRIKLQFSDSHVWRLYLSL